MRIVYAGTADFKEFSAADFKKAGLEDQKKIVFQPGVVVEVSDEVGQALIADEGLFATDSFQEVADDEEGVDPREVPSNVIEGDLQPAGVQESMGTDTPAPTGGKARGGTTRGTGSTRGTTGGTTR